MNHRSLRDRFTDHLYIGLRGDICVVMEWKRTDAKYNARVVRDLVASGCDVQTVHKDDARKYWEQMRERVAAAAQKETAA